MKGALACYVEAVRALQDGRRAAARRRADRRRLRRDREDAVGRRAGRGVPRLRGRLALPRHARRRRRHVHPRRADRRAASCSATTARSGCAISTRGPLHPHGVQRGPAATRTRSCGCARCSTRCSSGSPTGRTTGRRYGGSRASSTSARSRGGFGVARVADARTAPTSSSTSACRRRSRWRRRARGARRLVRWLQERFPDYGIEWEVYVTAPGAEIEEGHELVARDRRAPTRRSSARRPSATSTRWFSDASVLTRYGIATVNYGTSSGLPDAELGENLEIDGLVETAGSTRCAAQRVCGSHERLRAAARPARAGRRRRVRPPRGDGGAGARARVVDRAGRPAPSSARSAPCSTSTRAPASPDWPVPEGWDAIPGARGCTPQSCGFRDHAEELRELGVAGRRALGPDARGAGRARGAARDPLPGDRRSRAACSRDALGLPTFEFEGATLYKRVTLVFEAGRDREGLLPGLPARPERRGGGRMARLVTFDEGRVGRVEGDEIVVLDVPTMREWFERGGAAETGERVPLDGRAAAAADRPEEVLPHRRQLPRARGGVEAGRLVAQDRALDRLLPERRRARRPGRAGDLPGAPDRGARLRARAGGRDRQATASGSAPRRRWTTSPAT